VKETNMSVTLRRLWIQLTADRKRFGFFCAMLTVGLLLWARVIVVSNIPRTAVAEDGKTTVQSLDHTIQTNSTAIDRLSRRAVQVRLDASPRRDPFVISTNFFPNPQINGQINQEAAKSGIKRDDNDVDLRMRQRREHLRSQAERLKVEAVMRGAGLAVIGGKTYRLGDEVPGRDDKSIRFQLLEVKQRSVVLQFEGQTFELELASPR
jgi:hypothetical protein